MQYLNGNHICNHIFDITQFVQLVLFLYVIPIGGVHAGNESAQRSDSIPLTDTQN
jgi:hypothetical protein